MKLNEFAKDDKLDELVGALARGIGGAAKLGAKAIGGTIAALDKASGTSADIMPGGALRGGASYEPSKKATKDPASAAERNREIQQAQKDMQDMIRAKEKEIQELRKQMSELQRQR